MQILRSAFGAALVTAICAGPVSAAGSSPADAQREERWQLIADYLFDDREVLPTDSLIKIDAPKRAQDAALVPITLTMPEKDKIKSVYLVIDDNPAPLAAHVTFGSAADPGTLQLRVRIDTYTNVHAVAETKDGKLFSTAAFVKASGGCSAPSGPSDAEAMKGMGEMRMKFAESMQEGKPAEATLMIRHPNFNGMQMNQLTRLYTPARYIDKVTVSYGDETVLEISGDISMSTNPAIGFNFVPAGDGPMKVIASDTKGGHWEQSFKVPPATN
ncbi:MULTISPECIES: quinoprotein dehydrogenase-associated SoxYZ-like carrier [unclassified Sinorhizobium]|uniref:quinoprotein dehydrogenase-associated SoxYZ-like carrier n=1 Tax=unclassified Sinorhizobium TaxID=2613772 RepID=UPI0035267197